MVLLDPDQWRDGTFTAAAFSRTQLKQGTLSVCRVMHSNYEDVHQHVIQPQLDKKTERTLAGCATALCGDIRSIVDVQTSERLFCAIDDPVLGGLTGDYLGHAHLS